MHGGGHVGGGHVGGGHIPGGHVPGGHGHGGVPGPYHHQDHHGPSDPAGPGLPGVAPISARGWLRRSDTPMSLHIVRAAVLLAVIGVLLWIGLHG
jgi:hypothetical protein